MRIIVFSLISFFVPTFLAAQDIHFSQFNSSPLNLNPAMVGNFTGDYRFVSNYRNQWSSLPVPYQTFSFSADTKRYIHKFLTGYGILINADQSGDANFRTFQLGIPISYSMYLKDSNQVIQFGILPSMYTKSFNASFLNWDNQYTGDGFDPNIASIENFSSTQKTFFDFSAAINWELKLSNFNKIIFGSSIYHINSPKQSFYNDKIVQLDKRFQLNALYSIKVSNSIYINPSALLAFQGKYKESIAGASLRYQFLSENYGFYGLQFGIYHRLKDAFIFTSHIDYENYTVGISYDINISPFKVATNYRGGIELSFIYIFKKFIPIKAVKKICPVFI